MSNILIFNSLQYDIIDNAFICDDEYYQNDIKAIMAAFGYDIVAVVDKDHVDLCGGRTSTLPEYAGRGFCWVQMRETWNHEKIFECYYVRNLKDRLSPEIFEKFINAAEKYKVNAYMYGFNIFSIIKLAYNENKYQFNEKDLKGLINGGNT